jgi:hypothetical protein
MDEASKVKQPETILDPFKPFFRPDNKECIKLTFEAFFLYISLNSFGYQFQSTVSFD